MQYVIGGIEVILGTNLNKMLEIRNCIPVQLVKSIIIPYLPMTERAVPPINMITTAMASVKMTVANPPVNKNQQFDSFDHNR